MHYVCSLSTLIKPLMRSDFVTVKFQSGKKSPAIAFSTQEHLGEHQTRQQTPGERGNTCVLNQLEGCQDCQQCRPCNTSQEKPGAQEDILLIAFLELAAAVSSRSLPRAWRASHLRERMLARGSVASPPTSNRPF